MYGRLTSDIEQMERVGKTRRCMEREVMDERCEMEGRVMGGG